MRIKKLRVVLFRLAVAALVLASLNAVLLAVLLLDEQAAPNASPPAPSVGPAIAQADEPAPTPPTPSDQPQAGSDGETVEDWIRAAMVPLSNAAQERGLEPVIFLPNEAEIAAASSSESFESEESQTVLSKLHLGYRQFEMSLPLPHALTQPDVAPDNQ